MSLVALFGLVTIVRPALAETTALSTPPALVAPMSPDQLNAFGLRMANEAYAIMGQVGSPKGQIGGSPNQFNKNAVKNAKTLFDDAALIQNARLNYGLTKTTFRPTDIDDTIISDMVVNRGADDVLVLAFNARQPNRADLGNATLMSGEIKPRLVVVRWNSQKKRWLVISSADFDTPKQAVCAVKPTHPEKRAHFKAADVALAKTIFEQLQDASFAGTEKSVQAPGFTYVLADGQRKTQDGPVRNKLQHRQTPKNVEAIRSGNLLVFRIDVASALTVDGQPQHSAEKPRLITMIQDEDGKWRMLAIGIFHVPASLAAGTPCVQPTVK
ncbi:MAG: hypothetical protein FGM26_14415 [Beijerinckiaceae bacterium]|nr:hypothetical protein [Beijerinckiaceae bacterium]